MVKNFKNSKNLKAPKTLKVSGAKEKKQGLKYESKHTDNEQMKGQKRNIKGPGMQLTGAAPAWQV